MRETKHYKLSYIAKFLDLEFSGEDILITAINSLEAAGSTEIAFVYDKKKQKDAEHSNAGVLVAPFAIKGKRVLVTDEVHLKFALLSRLFAPKRVEEEYEEPSISPSTHIYKGAYISRGARIGNNCTIYPGVFIDIGCTIGDRVVIYPNVSILNGSKIGNDCILHPGCVIGGDGYGYAHTKKGEHIKIYHFGNVILEDGVEVGSNSTVDRSIFGSTVIKKGTKIDNLVMIGHNCEVGENSLLVAQVGLAGSTKLGRNVIMGGQSGSSGHLEIVDFVTIGGRTAVTKDVKKSGTYSGYPMMDHKKWLKYQAKLIKLTEVNSV